MKVKLVRLPSFMVVLLGKYHTKLGIIDVGDNKCINSKYIEILDQRRLQIIEKIDKKLSKRLKPLFISQKLLENKLYLEETKTYSTEKELLRIQDRIREIKYKITEINTEIELETNDANINKTIINKKFNEIVKNYELGVKKVLGKEKKDEIK